MKRTAILTVLVLSVGYSSSRATIINVPGDYPTIQEGVEASTDGDTVLVEPGTYVENVNFNGHNIVLGSLFLLTGDPTYVLTTIIDGDSSGSVVTFENGEDSTASLTGFTIRNGYASRGGGIYCNLSNPIVANNLIVENTSGIHGGGIYCAGARPKIDSNVISRNSTYTYGAGIACSGTEATITNNVIIENVIVVIAGGSGGGISSSGNGVPVIANNLIMRNRATTGGGIRCNGNALIHGNMIIENTATVGFEQEGYGGGILCSFSDAVITGNIISNNSAVGQGGGIFCSSSDIYFAHNIVTNNNASSSMGQAVGGGILLSESNPTIISNVVSRNSAGNSGGGIYCELVSNPVITNTILWEDSASHSAEIDFDDSSSPVLTYCDIQGGWAGQGNIDIDPLFRAPDDGDFHLMSSACGDPYDSPCIDTGHPDILDSLLDCSWGLGGLRSDMGAYGGGDSVVVRIGDEVPWLPNGFSLSQNFPNPFNASTIIQYSLPEPSEVTIVIYDLLGRRVKTLVDGKQPAGHHRVTWNSSGVSSGVYFYRMQAGEYSHTRKTLLLK